MPPVELDAHDVTSCDAHDASTKKPPAALSLCDAVTAGNLELVNQLLDEGADPNSLSTDWYKTRPLIIAANAGHASIVRRLLDHPDIQPNLTDGVFGNTALMGACQEGHRDVVRRMIAHPKVDIKFQTAKTGTTALMEASRYGHADVVAMLIGEHPATEDLGGVNLQTKAGTTALMLSCMAHRDKVLWGARHVKLILGVGALDINIKDNQGRNAEDWSRLVVYYPNQVLWWLLCLLSLIEIKFRMAAATDVSVVILLLVYLHPGEGIGDFGLSCRADKDCTKSDANLRCVSKIDLKTQLFEAKRCECRYRWTFRGGVCRPGGKKKEEKNKEKAADGGKKSVAEMLVPVVTAAVFSVIAATCCCCWVHTGNNDLRREIKENENDVEERYKVEEEGDLEGEMRSRPVSSVSKYSARRELRGEGFSDAETAIVADSYSIEHRDNTETAVVSDTYSIEHTAHTYSTRDGKNPHKTKYDGSFRTVPTKRTSLDSTVSSQSLSQLRRSTMSDSEVSLNSPFRTSKYMLHPLSGVIGDRSLVEENSIQRSYQNSMRFLMKNSMSPNSCVNVGDVEGRKVSSAPGSLVMPRREVGLGLSEDRPATVTGWISVSHNKEPPQMDPDNVKLSSGSDGMVCCKQISSNSMISSSPVISSTKLRVPNQTSDSGVSSDASTDGKYFLSRDKNLEYVKKLIKEASVHNIGGGEARVEMLQLREKVEELENLLDKSENEKKVLQRKLDKILEERNTKDVGAGGDSDEISTKDVGAGGDCDEISTKDVGAGGDLAHVTTKDAAAGGEHVDEVTNDLAAQAL